MQKHLSSAQRRGLQGMLFLQVLGVSNNKCNPDLEETLQETKPYTWDEMQVQGYLVV